MKRQIILCLLLLISACTSKNFNEKVENAESCIFHAGKFYFANYDNDGAFINSYDMKTWTRYRIEGLKKPFGIAAYEDLILINDVTQIHFYSLEQNKILKTLKAPGAIQLNDIAIDDKGNFFSADSKAKKIYSGHIKSPIVSEYIKVDFVPNGLLIDEDLENKNGKTDKLLIASWGDEIDDSWNTKQRGRLWSYSFGDNKLKLFSEKRVGYLDGIAKLGPEKYLVSAKRENEIYLFEKDREPKLHSKATGPADIAVSDSMICVPSFSHKKVEIKDL